MAKSTKEGYEVIPSTVTYNMPPKTAAEIAEQSAESIDAFLRESQISALQQVLNPVIQQMHDRGFPLSTVLEALEQSLTLHWTNLHGGYAVAAMDRITWLLDDAVKLAKEQESKLHDRIKQNSTPVLIVNAKNEAQARKFWGQQNEIAEAVICGDGEATIEAFQFEVWLNGSRFANEGTERGLSKIVD
ncbi:MAG: hypothetical protein KME16_27495 [Scytolyngbya sp. HA4215-MV1]|nr:hypothetical protein [Scytolyngbya sp. HA4215-MV1]